MLTPPEQGRMREEQINPKQAELLPPKELIPRGVH